jgi:hypothetical protein
MTRARLEPERRAFRLFGDALLAFSDDPGPDNLERYLAASRGLEESRRAREKRTSVGRRTKGATAVRNRRTLAGDTPIGDNAR